MVFLGLPHAGGGFPISGTAMDVLRCWPHMGGGFPGWQQFSGAENELAPCGWGLSMLI